MRLSIEYGRVAVSYPEEIHTVQYLLAAIIQIKLNQLAEIIHPVQQRVKIKRKRGILPTRPELGIKGFIASTSHCKRYFEFNDRVMNLFNSLAIYPNRTDTILSQKGKRKNFFYNLP